MSEAMRAAVNDPGEDLSDDLLVGARAIADWFGWAGKTGERRVYNMAEKRQAPIHRIGGLGLCARKSSLRRFFGNLDAPFLQPIDASRKLG